MIGNKIYFSTNISGNLTHLNYLKVIDLVSLERLSTL